MSSLEYLIGKPIVQFIENRLPTLKDVLCFYAQYWSSPGIDSSKAKVVARELIQFYQREGILVMSEKTIIDRISKKIAELKTILKFKSKIRTAANHAMESLLRSKLNNVFEIRRPIQNNNQERENVNENESMDVDVDSDSDFLGKNYNYKTSLPLLTENRDYKSNRNRRYCFFLLILFIQIIYFN